jgi:nitrite reductase/ring-hydroxylating ferredoxin subunit
VDATYDTGLRPDEIDPERPWPLATPWGDFSLFRAGARVFCVQSFCPHLGGPLFQGTVGLGRVTCPWHEWSFSLETGRRVDLAGRVLGRGAALARCAVALSGRGTIVLSPPDRPIAG